MNMGMQKNWKYFAPRLGISYRMNNATVIRAGFGVSYTPFPDNTYAYNFPVKQNNQYTTGASDLRARRHRQRPVLLHGDRLPGSAVGRDSVQRDHHQPVADAERYRDSAEL